MVKRLKRRIFKVSGDRDLVDARWDGDMGTVCILVKNLSGSGWRVHDALFDGNGFPRNICEHDIDRLAWRYNSSNVVEQDDPFAQYAKAEMRRNERYERDKVFCQEEALREQLQYDRRFGADGPMGSRR
jgi:hypothetical protein